MKVNSIKIQWFRGSASEVALGASSKSVVVYGPNGSGKSSFIDAVEYIIHKGKLEHLAHEYSGRRQEKGIINTHAPANVQSQLLFDFNDGKNLGASINTNGEYTLFGTNQTAMDGWEYMRTILRQHEVADFITGTKGEKYSALLPLLGLHNLEFIAENFRQLARTVERESKIANNKSKIEEIIERRRVKMGEIDLRGANDKVDALYKKYVPAGTDSNLADKCAKISESLSRQIDGLDALKKLHAILTEISLVSLTEDIKSVRIATSNLVSAADPLIQEKLAILQTAEALNIKLGATPMLNCPACGRELPADEFKSHIDSEKKKLQSIISLFGLHKSAVANLCNDILKVKNNFQKEGLGDWKKKLIKDHMDKIQWLTDLDVEVIRGNCSEENLGLLETNVMPLIDVAKTTMGNQPGDVRQLIEDKEAVQIADEIIEEKNLSDIVTRSQALMNLLQAIEAGARQEIRGKSEKIIGDISADIQKMWEVLHPDKKIENIRLYLPDDADKAVDVRLKFYGIEQDSPRLTLSEGNRNSLGLCIFLAMAKKDERDRPLFLDDVIISLDRGYRGMIADLLIKEFSEKQVFIFTHDREWFVELKQRLDATSWQFKTLMPWEDPSVGIRWSARTMSFDDARKDLDKAPDLAGTTARKLMDIELAPRAEMLKIKLPYLHRERNDHRVAHEFLEKFIADGMECFEIKDGHNYKKHDEAINAFRKADSLILAWANRATHTFDAEKNEADQLIKACENALEFFDCTSCKKSVGRLEDAKSKLKQCQCGNLRWRYGKA